jgi:threonine dehydrogenase-like Zn-dependent dehydrogenase
MAGAKVGMIGTREERLTLSKELGADFTENVKGSLGWEKEVLKMSGGHGFDICIEAAGTASGLLSALRLVKKGGTVVEFGTSIDLIDGLPQKDFYSREISIVGSKGGYGFYRKAIELLESHQIRIEPLITHTFTLEETPKAFEVMDRRLDKVIRAAVAVS